MESIEYMESLIEKKVAFKNLEYSTLDYTKKLVKAHKMDDFLSLGTPLTRLLYNNCYVDRLNIKQYLLMKLASVIGE